MKKPFYTSAAQHDLAEILAYIAKDRSGAAIAWVEKIERKCMLVAENPSTGQLQPHLGEGVRASVVGRYVIFHRKSTERVEILRVIPGDRDIRQL
jgi:toxin ParE1/3/4